MAKFRFKFWDNSQPDSGLQEIFPFKMACSDFIYADMHATYTKIMVDTLERTRGIKPEIEDLLWDNCVQSNSQQGLISLIVWAMVNEKELFIVYKPSVQIVRKADQKEEKKIREDYAKKGHSSVGVFISFQGYSRSKMLRVYSEMEYFILCSLYKTVNVSKALQFKISNLRSSVAERDSAPAQAQGVSISRALGAGKDIMIDSEDSVESATPDISPTEKAISFLDAKRAFILSLPISYITGVQTGGIGSTGEADMRAVERGLKQYFVQIIKPVMKAVFDIEVTFESQDFRQITSSLEIIKSFTLTQDSPLLSEKAQQEITARAFGYDPEEERRQIEKEQAEREEQRALNQEQFNQNPNNDPNEDGEQFNENE